MSGRRAEASRNDERILESARAVFVANPDAPISAVAEHAGVGISALYRRYASKDELLRTLCWDGLRRYTAIVEEALADEGDVWEAFKRYLRRAVEADTSSLTQKLAGTFTPVEQMWVDAARANQLSIEIHERAAATGKLRSDIESNDISLILEQLAGLRLGSQERTIELRLRYLDLILEALEAPGRHTLSGSAPTWDEVSQRWSS